MIKFEYIDWTIMITEKPTPIMTISSVLKDETGEEVNRFYYWQGTILYNENLFAKMGLIKTGNGIWQANVKKKVPLAKVAENNSITRNVKTSNKIVKILHGVFDLKLGGNYAMER